VLLGASGRLGGDERFGSESFVATAASTNAYTDPNSAFVTAGGPSVDERLESPSVAIATPSTTVTV
jgi:hypothetical protein